MCQRRVDHLLTHRATTVMFALAAVDHAVRRGVLAHLTKMPIEIGKSRMHALNAHVGWNQRVDIIRSREREGAARQKQAFRAAAFCGACAFASANACRVE